MTPPRPQNRSKGPRRKPLDPARGAAFEVLRAVSEREAYANLALPPLLRRRSITGRDAAFATELTYGTCRTQGLLDCGGHRRVRLDPGAQQLIGAEPEQIEQYRVDHLR